VNFSLLNIKPDFFYFYSSTLVNGIWQLWSDWSERSVTCGGGISNRNRTCDGPYHGGLDCMGDMEQDRVCNTNLCPSK
jgi:hypothetical protein